VKNRSAHGFSDILSMVQNQSMATYILVHGAWHGGWCWHSIVARLRQASHDVIAPDLLSLGRDCTATRTITLARWAEQIAALVQAAPEPVVLVGHSRGGIVLSEVAERIPERIRTLIYVSAYLLDHGRSLQDAAAEDPESLVVPAVMTVNEEQLSVSLREEAVRDIFYGQCSDEQVLLAQSLLRPEPLLPLATPVSISAARFGRVPRVYIECTLDRVITHAAQRRMQTAVPGSERITLETDHSPFFSRADELAAALLRTARNSRCKRST
jgi:pimeloyl-ACP methyl ester carboxylesterase